MGTKGRDPWLREETRVQEVVGQNPSIRYRWIFFTLICCKNCILCLKKAEIEQKEDGDGPFD